MTQTIAATVAVLVSLAAFACKKDTNGPDGDARVVQRDDRILIVDRTGKEWDVTHAVQKYGFVAENFQFGLGPFAIRPILKPEMLSPGDAGYPDPRETFLVLGTVINNEARAYPIPVMTWHEIADESFGETHVAVAY